jgi:hypothetical protein
MIYLGGFVSPLNRIGSMFTVEISHAHSHDGDHDHHHHHEPVDPAAPSAQQEGSPDAESRHTHNVCVSHCSPVWLGSSFSFVMSPPVKQMLHPFAPAVFSSVNLGAIFRPPIA